MLEDLTQRRTHGHPHVAQVRRLTLVVQGLGTHASHTGEGTRHHPQDIGDLDLIGAARQTEATFGAPLGGHEATTAEVGHDGAEELGGQVLLLGEVLGTHGAVTGGQRQEGANRVLSLGRNLHPPILPYVSPNGDAVLIRVGPVFDLVSRSLYLCVGVRDDLCDFVAATLRGGVDVVQLREKDLPDSERVAAARRLLPICRDFGVPFVMNDSPELALEVGADGVHVGQDDASVARCRELLGADAIVGLSTHADSEFDAGLREPVTYLSAGPIVATPTKAGREGTGVDYAVRATARSHVPVFVTGGVSADNVGALVDAGLRHFVVVRHLTEATNPEVAARSLRSRLDDALARVD